MWWNLNDNLIKSLCDSISDIYFFIYKVLVENRNKKLSYIAYHFSKKIIKLSPESHFMFFSIWWSVLNFITQTMQKNVLFRDFFLNKGSKMGTQGEIRIEIRPISTYFIKLLDKEIGVCTNPYIVNDTTDRWKLVNKLLSLNK